jgi:ribose transport system permease protein
METTLIPTGRKRPARQLSLLSSYSREASLLGLIALIIIVFSILYPRSFFSRDNFVAVLNNLATDGILAVGMMLMMVGGVFDLSVGSMVSLAGVVTAALMKKAGWPVPAAVLAGLGVAGLGGLLNGFIVARVRVNALITTLGTMLVFQGMALQVGGPGISFLPDSFSRAGQGEFLRLQSSVWLMLSIALLFHLFMTHTRFFRQYYYIGSNPRAARLSGIRVERLQMLSFVIMGLLAGVAGIAYAAARVNTAVSNVGVGAELRAITAVILGGASLTGGKGRIVGALGGVLFTGLITNVLIIARVPSYWQGNIQGAVLVLAVALDSLWTRSRR